MKNGAKQLIQEAKSETQYSEIEQGLEKDREELEATKKSADEASEFAECIINTVREPLITLDQDLRVVKVNRSFYEFFKVKPEETVGQLIYDLGNKQWDIPKLRELLKTILPQKATFDNYEVEHNFATIGKRIMLLNARQVERGLGKERIILLAIEDITERKQMEEGLKESEERYRTTRDKYLDLYDFAPTGCFTFDRNGILVDVNLAGSELLGSEKHRLIGNQFTSSISPDSQDAFYFHWREVLKTGIKGNCEIKMLKADGTLFPAQLISIAMPEKDGNINHRRLQCRTAVIDITERKRLEAAQVELELMKTQFISNVSHELRTPLQSIKGFTKLMLQGKVTDPETQKEFLTMIDSGSEHLCGLIEDLLDMSRLEFGRFGINMAPVSIRDLIHNVVQGFYGTAKHKSIVITEDMAAALPEIEADKERLRQVMVNLLGNAIKFSKNGGSIIVKAETRDSKVLVQVTDHGIGIPEAFREHLFEKFYQGDGSITRSYGGSGLGLYISKQIIEAHGGSIWGESKLGKETTFAFVIPRASERGRKKIGEIMVEDELIYRCTVAK